MNSDEIELERQLIQSIRYKCRGAKVIDNICHGITDDSAPLCNKHGQLSKVWTLKLKGIYVTCYMCLFKSSDVEWYHCNFQCSGDIQTTELYDIGYHFRHSITGKKV